MTPIWKSTKLGEDQVTCSSWSTISVKSNAYSVPSQLIGEKLCVKLFDTKLEIYLGGKLQMTVERLPGKKQHRINYRHVIDSLIRKAGAFARYRYRDDLFPTLTFRRSYDALVGAMSLRTAEIEYLRCLHLAAKTMECEVETAMAALMSDGHLPMADEIKNLVAPRSPVIPDVDIEDVNLSSYDALLVECAEICS